MIDQKRKKGLQLKRITITRLQPDSMETVRGGGTGYWCNHEPTSPNQSGKVSCYIPDSLYEETNTKNNTSIKNQLC